MEAARGPMLAVTDPKVRKITVMACTQLLKTELLNNIVGYFIHQDPSPMIVIQPNETLAQAWSKDRLDKMLRDTPALRGKVKDKRSKDGDNTILHKSFPGGHITVAGSNSPAGLAMRPVRVVLCDEVDKYPRSAGEEGDPIKIVAERSATFWNYLEVNVCSPTIEGSSRIALEYEQSDKRVFKVPCPHCEFADEMHWVNVKWPEGDTSKAMYSCAECEKTWTEPQRIKAVSKGHWEATAPFNGNAGFRVSKLASPWEPLSKLAQKWTDAQKSPELLKVFVNTQLAETWKEKGDAPEWQRLYERRETYPPNLVPPSGLLLTAGCDVQKDRFEVEIVAWGRDKQTWSIDYRVIHGDTALEATWDQLDSMLVELWRREDGGQMPISMFGIDSGYNTQQVYNWTRKHSANKVMATKGSDSAAVMVGRPTIVDMNYRGKRVRRGARVWIIGSSIIKSELYSWLRLQKPIEDGLFPPGYCHFPEYGDEFFKQLTAEQVVTRLVKGFPRREWVKIYERNEALDCRVIARSAACALGIDRFQPNHWQKIECDLGISTNLAPQASQKSSSIPNPAEGSNTRPRKRRESSFWDRRR